MDNKLYVPVGPVGPVCVLFKYNNKPVLEPGVPSLPVGPVTWLSAPV